MSDRDEQPITIPPPAGEDDAYSAATKVGEMPAEVMAKLRAEGLLPEESEEKPRQAAPRPSTALDSRVPNVVSDKPPDSGVGAPVPALFSTPPQTMEPVVEQQAVQSSMPPAFPVRSEPPRMLTPLVTGPPPAPVFSSRPPADVAVARDETEEDAADRRALDNEVKKFGGHSSRRLLQGVLAAVGLLLVLAFVMALMSQRR